MGWEDVAKDLDISRIVLDILPEEVGTSSSVEDCVHWLLDLTENVKLSVATEPDKADVSLEYKLLGKAGFSIVLIVVIRSFF